MNFIVPVHTILFRKCKSEFRNRESDYRVCLAHRAQHHIREFALRNPKK